MKKELILSDSEKKSPSDSQHLFENKFAYVTPEGDVHLKSTSYFEERKIGSVDIENVEEEIKHLESAFEELKTKSDEFIRTWKKKENAAIDKLKASFSDLKDELLSAEAIGDFETLIKKIEMAASDLEKKFSSQLKEEHAEKTTTEPEPVEETEDESSEPVESAEKPHTEAEKSDEPDEDAEAAHAAAEEKEDGEDDKSVDSFYASLAEKAENISEMTDWPYVGMEFENLKLEWEKGPDPKEADVTGYKERIEKAREEFEKRKNAHFEEQKKIREENLEKKKNLLQQLEEIVEKEKWTAENEVRKISRRWDKIKPVPKNEIEQLNERFQKLQKIFKEHKVDRLVQKKQQEQDNLMGKLVILEKMEKFLEDLGDDENWKEAEKEFEELSKQWRKIGRVPIEKNQEMWDKYHDVQEKFHAKRFKSDKKYRKQIEKFLQKKKKLIDEAEALVDADDLADAARRVNKLHRNWKKTGNLPQKEENELWDRFKAATDAFNEKKAENADLIREQENENLEKKYELIKEAEELKESDDFEGTHQKLQNLMKQWKEVGPVPKRKSGKIWKKFKGAMDHFYDRRRDHFKEVKEKRKDNLDEKKEILEQLGKLTTHEDPIAAVEEAKPLQEEFKKAGYVPIKYKNKMWKDYREICDVIYDRFRAAKSAAKIVGREHVNEFTADDLADIQKKQRKADSLKQEISTLTRDLIQMKESLSYFKPQKGSTMLDEVKEKIDKAEQSLSEKEGDLDQLEAEIDKLKK